MHVKITVFWGINDDAFSTIRISKSKWTKILAGESFQKPALGWYERKRFRVSWVLEDKNVSIIVPDPVIWMEIFTLDDLIIQY